MPLHVDPDSAIKLLAIAATSIAALVKRWFDGKAKVVVYLVHTASHPLPSPQPQSQQQNQEAAKPIEPLAAEPHKPELEPAEVGGSEASPPASSTSTSPSELAPNARAAAPSPPGWINTHSIVVRNSGKQTAHNVRIDHAIFPPSYNVYPPVSHSLSASGRQGAEILIPLLVAGEQITISYLYFPPLLYSQIGAWVKCDEGAGRFITAIPNTPVPWPLRWLVWVLAFVGASFVMYTLFTYLSGLLT